MKRVIVTGADGFVGSNIVAALLEARCFVYAVDRDFIDPENASVRADELQLVRADCADLPPLKADALIHAAFITATPEARGETPEANFRANVQPLLAVMEYVQRYEIGRAVFLSSNAVFRNAPATEIDETRPPQPLGVYAVAKTLMEQLVETMRQEYGRDLVCARLGAIYGPQEFPRSTRPKLSVVAQMIMAALTRGEIVVERPEARRQWTYAPDIGRALLALLSCDRLNHSLYNLASDEELANLEIAKQIRRRLDGISLRIADEAGDLEPLSTNRGRLDTSRLRRDTGYDDWTAMSASTVESTLDSIRARLTHA